MLLATIIAVTLIAFYAALLVGLHKDEPQGTVNALNYPVTFVDGVGESWAVRDDIEES